MRYLVSLLAVAVNLSAQTPTFQQTKIAVGCNPTKVVSGDFNGDHVPDLAFACRAGAQSPISILLGNGDGTFQTPISITSPAIGTNQGNHLVAADFTRDGKTDLAYVAASGDLLILVSLDDGTFRSITSSPVNSKLALAAAADMNGDGGPDLIFLSGQNDSFAVIAIGKTDGSFFTPAPIDLTNLTGRLKSFSADGLAVGDYNGDGRLDLMIHGTPVYSDPAILSASGVFTALSQPDGSYSRFLLIYANPPLVMADFNGDGKLDIAGHGFYDTAKSLDIYLNGTPGAPTNAGPYYDGPFAAADLNGDGRADLALTSGSLNALRIVSLKPDLTSQQTFIDLGASPGDVLIADLDGDGKPDIVTANSSNASILINTTPTAFVSAALNGASFATSQSIAPGSLISLFGTGIASSTAQASAIPLPVSLGGVSVAIGGVPAPLLFVSSKQLNVQVPWTLAAGPANVVVTVNGTALGAFQATVAALSPGIFSTQFGVGQAIAINSDGSLAGPEGSIPGIATHPAKPGGTIIVLATGLGAVTPSISTGEASSDALRNAVTKPTILIGGLPADVPFAGLSPQFVGVNQINVVVPKVAAGVLALQIDEGGVRTTDKVTIAVANP
jgi:uncharacterized protein (TIGR03437 family)